MTGDYESLVKKRKTYAVIAALILLAIVVVFAGRTKQGNDEPAQEAAETIEAEVFVVSPSSLPNSVSASGAVQAIQEAKIAPKIMSSVAAVTVNEGDRVRQGQVLIRLESNDLQAQLAQAEAGLSAALAGSGRADTGVGLQEVQTSANIANAQASLKSAREHLSMVKEGPRKQQRTQAHLAVAQAEAQFNNAKLELDRYNRLYEQDVVPKQRLDGVQAAYAIAKAQYESAKEQASMTDEGSRSQEIIAAQQQVQQAEQGLRLAKASVAENAMSVRNAQVAASQVKQARAAVAFAKTQLGYATITSPITGVVSARMVDPGDTVSPGMPVICVQSDSRYRLEVTVPESAAGDMHIGKQVEVEIGADKRRGSGKVSVISPAGDTGSHKFLVKADLPEELNVRAGEFGRISFPVSFSKGVIIPAKALKDAGGLPCVFIVDKQDIARMRMVKVGRTTPGGMEILSGLQAEDRVIIENTGVLTDGVRVKPRKPSMSKVERIDG